MSFFNTQNREALAVDATQVTRGRAMHFIEAFDASWEAQVRGASMFGIQEAMRELDDKQRDAMRKAGLEDVPSLSSKADDPLRMFTDFGYDYLDAARFFENGGTPEMSQRLNEYDAKISDIRKRYPDLNVMTSGEMWDNVRTRAQEAERNVSNMRNRDWIAPVGGFMGSVAASMNPNTDPLNFATLPVGGLGKSAGARIVTQGGAQGLIEGANQVLGVQEQRQLLGLDHGFMDAATRVGGALIGGAVVQGVGEAIGFGIRKAFKRPPPAMAAPDEPIPAKMLALPPPSAYERYPTIEMGYGIPENVDAAGAKLTHMPESFDDYVHAVSPTSNTRIGRGRTNVDIGHVEQQLEAWDGPLPVEMQPKTDTAVIRSQNDFTAIPALEGVVRQANIDDLARQADPDVVGRYGALADEKAALRTSLQEATAGRNAARTTNDAIEEIESQIAVLQHKASKSGAMKAKKANKQIEALQTQREELIAQAANTDTPYMQMIRERLVEVDERMRDLAEPLSRAYARARGKWSATEVEHEGVIQMMRQGSKENRADTEVEPYLPRVPSLQERVPLLQRVNEVPDLKKDADAADAVAAVLKRDMETVAEGYEQERATLKKLLAEDAKDDEGNALNTITLPGYKNPLHLDNDHVMVETATGGEERITVREMLQRQLDAEEDLAAVTSCSIVSTSKSA